MAREFDEKKYTSKNNLTKFGAIINSLLGTTYEKFKKEVIQIIEDRFAILSSKQQGDSEVVEARQGKVSLLENLKTFVRTSDFENSESSLSQEIREVKNIASENKTYIDSIKTPFETCKNFVNGFKVSMSLGENGYIKLPSVLGGLMLQWGVIITTHNVSKLSSQTSLNLPSPDFEKCYGCSSSIFGNNQGWNMASFISNTWVISDKKIYCQTTQIIEQTYTGTVTVKWFGIFK